MKLKENFKFLIDEAKSTPCFKAFASEVRKYLSSDSTDMVYVTRVRNKLVNREYEFLIHEIIPKLGDKFRTELIHTLNQADLKMAISTLVVLYAMPNYPPVLIAQEIVKPFSKSNELKMFRDAKNYLLPERFFSYHLSNDHYSELCNAIPNMFQTDNSTKELRDFRELATQMINITKTKAKPIRAVCLAYKELINELNSFDYGCGFGPLVECFASEYDAFGGDLYSPGINVSYLTAAIRSARFPEDAMDPSGNIAMNRIFNLDKIPSDVSPPGDKKYSVVTSSGVMEHILDFQTFDKVLLKMGSILKPGGILLVNTTPTYVGFDGHHAVNPWLGVILHRLPWVRRNFFKSQWVEDRSRRVLLKRLREPMRLQGYQTLFLYPNKERLYSRLGVLSIVVFPIGRILARLGLVPFHYIGLVKPVKCD